MNIIGHRKIYLTISAILIIASVASVFMLGLKEGIDFSGGTLWQMQFETGGISKDEVQTFFEEEAGVDVIVSPQEGNSFLVRLKEVSEENHQLYLRGLMENFGGVEELRFETIGSSIGEELRTKSRTVFIFVLLAISLYIAFAFRKVSFPVQSWKYGIITLVTLFHDVVISVGFFTVLAYLTGAETSVSFVVAVLVIMGFSVHDTIVVFDRIRENLRKDEHKKLEFSELVNVSTNQTIARSINTSLTLILVLVAVYALRVVGLEYFIATILVGTVIGTYSSIFVASPLLTLWKK